MDREFLACPACGSEFFFSRAEGQRIVFHVDSDSSPLILVMGDTLRDDQVKLNDMHCGACSWAGEADQLVPGH